MNPCESSNADEVRCLSTLADVAVFLAQRLPGAGDDLDVPLRWRVAADAEARPVRRLAPALDGRIRLEPTDGWDALFLHRPFNLPAGLPENVPILAAHGAFDAHLGLGYNLALAGALGLRDITPLYRHQPGRAAEKIGMVGALADPASWPALRERLSDDFGGLEVTADNGTGRIERLAVVGAMTAELVQDAADAGAGAYVTGQFREAARTAAEGRGVAVAAVGHRRSEMWGLRRLAFEIEEAFPGVFAAVLE